MTYISQEIPKAGATMSLWDGSLPEGVNPDDLPPSCFGPGEIKNITVKFRAFLKGLEKLGIHYVDQTIVGSGIIDSVIN